MNYQEYRQSLNQKLAERVERELVDFREDILNKSPQEIYDVAYQIVILKCSIQERMLKSHAVQKAFFSVFLSANIPPSTTVKYAGAFFEI